MDWTQERIEKDRVRFMNRRPRKPAAEVKINRNPQAHNIRPEIALAERGLEETT
jgi:hypothetical protein